MIKWTYEACYEEALKYKLLSEFISKNNSCYTTACKNKWIEDYTWLKRKRTKRGTWQIYENCYNEALKYKTRTELENNSSGCYEGARENGWLDTFTWLEDKRIDIIEGKIDSIYAYEFKEQNAVYIGRTLISLQKQRDYQHMFREDSVSKFAKENNIPLPKMKILETSLTIKEGAENEGIWIELYKEDGWKILNIAKAGSIGGLAKGKWNKESCYFEALKYTTLKEFSEAKGSAYSTACKHGWISDYIWLKHKWKPSVKVWTYDLCKEESLKYKHKGEFAIGSRGAYNKALKKGWLQDFKFESVRNPPGYWTYERCKEESKKYKTCSEWRKSNQTSYKRARDNGWLDEFFPKNK